MSRKSKGIAAERELIHLLWKAGFAAIRVAGSGSSRYPSCDILASNGSRLLALECKSIKSGTRYLPDTEMQAFMDFAQTFGAQPWIAARFARRQWHFLLPEDLKKTPSAYGIS
ncbi:MAG: Holliday junction resolvase Hjc, partial [Nanoarchaeota archaeon]